MKNTIRAMSKNSMLILLLVFGFCLSSCGNKAESGSQFSPKGDLSLSEEIEIEPPSSASSGELLAFNDQSGNRDGSTASQGGGSNEKQAEKTNKKIIRTAQLHIEVSNFQKAKEMVLEIARKNNAEIEKEEERNYDYRTETNMVIRIAPEKLDDFLVALETLGTQVHFKSIEAKDVTSQYIDLESRLANKQAVVKRYRELLAEARNVSDVLAVEEKLRLLVEEIESTQKSLQYLQGQVQRSVIHFNMFQNITKPVSARQTFWNQMGRAFGNGWDGFKQFLIGLFSLWPFLIVFGALGYWVIRRRKRRKGA